VNKFKSLEQKIVEHFEEMRDKFCESAETSEEYFTLTKFFHELCFKVNTNCSMEERLDIIEREIKGSQEFKAERDKLAKLNEALKRSSEILSHMINRKNSETP
jgi:hypothetical protein